MSSLRNSRRSTQSSSMSRVDANRNRVDSPNQLHSLKPDAYIDSENSINYSPNRSNNLLADNSSSYSRGLMHRQHQQQELWVSSQNYDKFGFAIDNTSTSGNDKPKANSTKSNKNDNIEAEITTSKLVKREAKWLNMIDNWDLWIVNEKEFNKVRSRCRKGIPSSIRGRAWFYLSGAHLSLKKYPRLFERLDKEPGDASICEEIKKDLHRQFPNHELFNSEYGFGQQSLFSVLKCFSMVRKDIGYCQGLAPVASILIMQMPPNHAFWTLLSISDNFIPGYYIPGFQAILLHGSMLFSLLKKYAPISYRILRKAEVDPQLVMLEWFMCLFVRNLPWPTVLRLWDMFLCEGIIVIFKAAILIIAMTIRTEHKKREQVDLLQLLRKLPEHELHESKFIPRIVKLDLTDKQLKVEHMKHLYKKQKVQQGK